MTRLAKFKGFTTLGKGIGGKAVMYADRNVKLCNPTEFSLAICIYINNKNMVQQSHFWEFIQQMHLDVYRKTKLQGHWFGHVCSSTILEIIQECINWELFKQGIINISIQKTIKNEVALYMLIWKGLPCRLLNEKFPVWNSIVYA